MGPRPRNGDRETGRAMAWRGGADGAPPEELRPGDEGARASTAADGEDR